jgi:hypothetical protein
MSSKSLPFAAALALSAALILSGCKSSPPPAAPAQGLNSDGTVSQTPPPPVNSPTTSPVTPSNPESSSTAPAPSPAPTPAPAVQSPPPPAAAEPAPPPPPPAPVRVTARAGASVSVTVTEQLSASHNQVGDRFTGVLAAPVKSSGGGTVFPRGARVLGTVVASKGQGKFKGAGALGIEVNSISGTPVSVSTYEKEQKGKGKRTAGFIGGGGGAGALIGGLAGGGKGALIGGLLGAGGGTAAGAFTGNKDVVIPSETTITFHLTAPVSVTVQPR